jgi:hypothetical protein
VVSDFVYGDSGVALGDVAPSSTAAPETAVPGQPPAGPVSADSGIDLIAEDIPSPPGGPDSEVDLLAASRAGLAPSPLPPVTAEDSGIDLVARDLVGEDSGIDKGRHPLVTDMDSGIDLVTEELALEAEPSKPSTTPGQSDSKRDLIAEAVESGVDLVGEDKPAGQGAAPGVLDERAGPQEEPSSEVNLGSLPFVSIENKSGQPASGVPPQPEMPPPVAGESSLDLAHPEVTDEGPSSSMIDLTKEETGEEKAAAGRSGLLG